MTTTYADYLQALRQLRDLPAHTDAELQQVRQAQDYAASLAEQATTNAQATAAATTKVIEAQLAAARTALEPLGKSSLVPPHIRSSNTPKSATSDDVANAQQALVRAVNLVRESVQAEITRIETEHEQLSSEAAQRAEAERAAVARAQDLRKARRRRIQIWSVVALAIAALVLILIL